MTRATDRVYVTTYEGRDLLGRIVENIDRVYLVESNAVARRIHINEHEREFPGIVADVQEHGISDAVALTAPTAPITRAPRPGRRKLTETDVRDMRARHANGTPTSILQIEYDVDRSTIAKIVSRKSWRHIL